MVASLSWEIISGVYRGRVSMGFSDLRREARHAAFDAAIFAWGRAKESETRWLLSCRIPWRRSWS